MNRKNRNLFSFVVAALIVVSGLFGVNQKAEAASLKDVFAEAATTYTNTASVVLTPVADASASVFTAIADFFTGLFFPTQSSPVEDTEPAPTLIDRSQPQSQPVVPEPVADEPVSSPVVRSTPTPASTPRPAAEPALRPSVVYQTVQGGVTEGYVNQKLAELEARLTALRADAQTTYVVSNSTAFGGNRNIPAGGSPIIVDGNYGIGTTSPYAPLSVSGQIVGSYFTGSSMATSTLAGGMNITSGCFAVNGTCLSSGVSSQWTTSSSDIYYTTGNVGIGTTSPYAKLSVAGTVVGQNFVATSTTAVSSFAGNVGIGTTSPWRTLSVTGSSDLGSNALAGTFTATSTTATSTFSGGFNAGTLSSNTGLTVLRNGKVGIGSQAPSALLHIGNNETSLINEGISRFNGNVGIGGAHDGYMFKVHGSGYFSNIGIGTTPVEPLTVNGNIGASNVNVSGGFYINGSPLSFNETDPNYFSNPSGYITSSALSGYLTSISGLNISQLTNDSGYVTGTGVSSSGCETVDVSNGLVTNCGFSDARFKTNITNVESALSKIRQVSGVTYDWNSTFTDLFPNKANEGRQLGFLAQDIQTHFPEVVRLNSNGYYSLEYSKLTAVLWEGTKELDAKVSTLENSLAALLAEALASSTPPVVIEDVTLAQNFADLMSTTKQWMFNKISAISGYFKNIYADVINTRKIKVAEGIELTDKLTGAVYCVIISNGNLERVQGECNSSVGAAGTQNFGSSNIVITNVGDTEGDSADLASTTNETATTTPETLLDPVKNEEAPKQEVPQEETPKEEAPLP